MKNIKEYTAADLRKLGVPEDKIKNLFYRSDSKRKGVYSTVITTTKTVKVINQETFDRRIKPLLEKKKKGL